MTISDPRKRLLDLLRIVAAYNDKGYQWIPHDAAQVALYRHRVQSEILQLTTEIGEQAFSADLLDMLKSGVAVRDDSGDAHLLAKSELS
ncbi:MULTISPECIES: hypothetical protein [unclassified Rhizobium]|uniref:hypothetical protein n=1 Tax=unclassified Rhizobium TaxID=2613769 RepID=UPI001A9A207D|nr:MULTISPECIES: hypothetical protein [unclassified Rhizobium]MBX5161288.1 hypothetical protein [Rhizobium sp. NZLR8]MBX5168195.1 hypothetical protein [Rhizobium sp. NZLR4b]MBX5174641.1 hypothetical protein [Rhizobium sp. NZLR1b]MBX5181046.1 hypothetical protein [Rhizobium sp. NZLR5]MBX5187951.1 hypothetical protein [Rhizobium sp. NZLR3b]